MLAIVVEAVLRIGRRALKNTVMISIAGLAFIAIFIFNIPFPLIVLTAAVIGYLGGRFWLDTFLVIKGHATEPASTETVVDAMLADHAPAHTKPSWRRAVIVALVCLVC